MSLILHRHPLFFPARFVGNRKSRALQHDANAFSATAQIAAMEAKLAAMDQTKPQDADYIPGSSTFPLIPLESARASPSASAGSPGSASPGGAYNSPRRGVGSPDRYYVPSPRSRLGTDPIDAGGRVGTPGRMGNVGQEAEDLEREFQAEFGVNSPITPPTGTDRPAREVTGTTEEVPVSSISKLVNGAGLPAKPAAAPIPPTPAEIRQVARDQTFKKGLAGLPKRPAFR